MLVVLGTMLSQCTSQQLRLPKRMLKSQRNLQTTSLISDLRQLPLATAKRAKKEGRTVTVLVPQFIPKKSWQNILHNQMSLKLKYYLKWYEDVVVASYSYHLKE